MRKAAAHASQSAMIAGMLMGTLAVVNAQQPTPKPEVIGERPVITEHLDQNAINNGTVTFGQLFEAGRKLFVARFNVLDGQGRPASTGNPDPPTRRMPDPSGPPSVLSALTRPQPQRGQNSTTPAFTRVSGPTTNSCAGCHNQPFVGGAGEFVANVIETANFLVPITREFSGNTGNERNSPGMNGAGVIELLAREMSQDLRAIRAQAIQTAIGSHQPVIVALKSKGVSFGTLTVSGQGTPSTQGIEGVDPDLIIKPWTQKGIMISLRTFSNFAFNTVSGIQSTELFGPGMTGTNDFDQDGVPDELTSGDLTAASIFQAALSVPGRVYPTDAGRRGAVDQGEQLFGQIGCTSCHMATLPLNSTVFTEPGPFNPPGNLSAADVAKPFSFDLTQEGQKPRLAKELNASGQVLVHAFTDMKRHVIGDADYPHFLNEKVVQNGVPTSQFLTKRLWDVGSTDPYGHRGDLTTLTEAIINHGGEGRQSRDAFASLSPGQQGAIIEFLKSMQIMPEGITNATTSTASRKAPLQ